MSPGRFFIALALVLPCAAAQAEDLPRSPACRTAVQALEDAEDALMAHASADGADPQQRQSAAAIRLQPLRQRVADACLGGLTTSPSPAQHTWVVPDAPVRPGLAQPRSPQPATPAVTLPRFEMPATVTHCTAAVCFTSDGSTLTRVGPGLVGPRGLCTVQGGFVRCP